MYPIRDTHTAILLLAQSMVDHLRALAAAFDAPKVIYAPSTIVRGALEAGATAGHLLREGISADERVVVYFNWRLYGIKEQLILAIESTTLSRDERSAEMARLEAIEQAILASAAKHGLAVEPRRNKDEVRDPAARIGPVAFLA